jgi:hypothetical protein
MSVKRDWIDVRLDTGSRRGAAEALSTFATRAGEADSDAVKHLQRMLRSSRSEMLLDHDQAQALLGALEVDGRMSALRARLQAFLTFG